MDLENLEKFISENKNAIKHKENKGTLLIFDRERPKQVILSALTSLIYNKYFNLIPSVITSGDSKGWTKKIYNSYGITKIFCINKSDIFTKYFLITLISIFQTLKTLIQTKYLGFEWFIREFTVQNARIGDLVYDSYIREGHKYLNLKVFDLSFVKFLFNSILKVNIFSKIFKKQNVKFIIVNSSSYAKDQSLGLRIGIEKNIGVLMLTRMVYRFYFDKKHYNHHVVHIYENDLNNYKFDKSWEDEVNIYLEKRFNGKLSNPDVIKAYSNKSLIDKKSLFIRLKLNPNQFSKIVTLAPHCFTDAAHCMGSMIFRDFFEDFVETLKFVRKIKNVLWIVKPHPTRNLYDEGGVIEKILEKYCKSNQNIHLCPSEISTKSILEISDHIVTCRGTIGLEFACVGKQAIITGESYYSDWGFCFKPRTTKEYFYILENLNLLKPLNDELIKKAKKIFYIKDVGRRKDFASKLLTLDDWSHEKIDKRFIDSFFSNLNIKKDVYDENFEKDKYFVKLKKDILKNNYQKL